MFFFNIMVNVDRRSCCVRLSLLYDWPFLNTRVNITYAIFRNMIGAFIVPYTFILLFGHWRTDKRRDAITIWPPFATWW